MGASPSSSGKQLWKEEAVLMFAPPSLCGFNKGAFDMGNRHLIFTLNMKDREKIHTSRQCLTDVQSKVNFFFSRLQVKCIE